ncbi:MAG TPA: GDP-mannose 4,6-dehydratase [Candidatus Acidoferrales bacterium]|nr:GDP-mannose 4,6-dehydratase [Candidatus Acidoferrales bacterium]
MRALVTGASGFVGSYLLAALRGRGDEVLACGGMRDKGEFFPLELCDLDAVRAAIDLARPDVIYHLAAQTFVPDSLASPTRTYEVNVVGTATLTQAVRDYAATGARAPRIVFTSSSEVYGRREAGDFPLGEALDLRPNNPYAASKAAAEAILLAESRCFRMDVIVARAFNHIGPGQSDRFVVASMAAQLARAALEKTPLLVGNLEASRDFLDVRDVVAAYLLLAQRGERGEVYNVCSGNPVKIREILGELIRIAHVPVEVREDPSRMRPLDTPLFVGDNRKLRDATGWTPEVPLRHSLRDVYESAVAGAGNPQAGS